MILEVWVIPNASLTGITGTRGEEVVLRVNAPAIEGKANRAAIRYLARFWGPIVRGTTGWRRNK